MPLPVARWTVGRVLAGLKIGGESLAAQCPVLRRRAGGAFYWQVLAAHCPVAKPVKTSQVLRSEGGRVFLSVQEGSNPVWLGGTTNVDR